MARECRASESHRATASLSHCFTASWHESVVLQEAYVVRELNAIVVQTVRSSVRSRVFHVLFALILLAVFLLPLTVSGDGTARGQLQISLTYSLGVVVALISTCTLWLSCGVLAREIESYSIHMVVTKPVPRWKVWLGKWLGVFLMESLTLLVSAAIILALVRFRVARGDFSTEEMARLNAEVLVGRRVFEPDIPDFTQLARQEYENRLKAGTLDARHNPQFVMEEMLRQVKAKSTEVPPNTTRFWRFSHVRVADPEERMSLRYRFYVGSTSRSSQRMTQGLWVVRDPTSKEKAGFAAAPVQTMGGNFNELQLRGSAVDLDDNTVIIGYSNEGPQGDTSLIFQHGDGPMLLVRVTGFLSNYIRSMVLAVFQLAFLAALGCTVGAAFSTPVAVFVAVSYLVIGMFVQAAVKAPLTNEFGEYQYKNVGERVLHYIALTVRKVIVSVDDFDATSDLAGGRLVEWARVGTALLGLVVLRGGIMAALGMWILTRREVGLEIRR